MSLGKDPHQDMLFLSSISSGLTTRSTVSVDPIQVSVHNKWATDNTKSNNQFSLITDNHKPHLYPKNQVLESLNDGQESLLQHEPRKSICFLKFNLCKPLGYKLCRAYDLNPTRNSSSRQQACSSYGQWTPSEKTKHSSMAILATQMADDREFDP